MWQKTKVVQRYSEVTIKVKGKYKQCITADSNLPVSETYSLLHTVPNSFKYSLIFAQQVAG